MKTETTTPSDQDADLALYASSMASTFGKFEITKYDRDMFAKIRDRLRNATPVIMGIDRAAKGAKDETVVVFRVGNEIIGQLRGKEAEDFIDENNGSDKK